MKKLTGAMISNLLASDLVGIKKSKRKGTKLCQRKNWKKKS